MQRRILPTKHVPDWATGRNAYRNHSLFANYVRLCKGVYVQTGLSRKSKTYLSPLGPRGPRSPLPPVKPVSPRGPSFPGSPIIPGTPTSPFSPLGPSRPCGPLGPSGPVNYLHKRLTYTKV